MYQLAIDIYEVVHSAVTKSFGFTAYYPRPELCGHCIPIDPFYLTWKAKKYDINTNMPRWVIAKTMDALNEQEKSLKGAKILIY